MQDQSYTALLVFIPLIPLLANAVFFRRPWIKAVSLTALVGLAAFHTLIGFADIDRACTWFENYFPYQNSVPDQSEAAKRADFSLFAPGVRATAAWTLFPVALALSLGIVFAVIGGDRISKSGGGIEP